MTPVDESWYHRPEGFPERTGAGGVVLRVEDDRPLLALVKEVKLGDDHYVLPKGGVEAGENLLDAARREIAEESGLTELYHLGEVGVLGRQNFRKTYWQTSHYALFGTTQCDGVITDPDNYGLTWVSPRELPPMFWPDERELITGRYDWMIEAVARWARGGHSSSS